MTRMRRRGARTCSQTGTIEAAKFNSGILQRPRLRRLRRVQLGLLGLDLSIPRGVLEFPASTDVGPPELPALATPSAAAIHSPLRQGQVWGSAHHADTSYCEGQATVEGQRLAGHEACLRRSQIQNCFRDVVRRAGGIRRPSNVRFSKRSRSSAASRQMKVQRPCQPSARGRWHTVPAAPANTRVSREFAGSHAGTLIAPGGGT